MRLFVCEWKKVAGIRFLWMFLAVLFLLNGACALYNTEKNGAYTYADGSGYYAETTDRILRTANANLREYAIAGMSENSMAWQYQQRLIDHYENARENVCFTESNAAGWDAFFADHTLNLFLLLAAILLGSAGFYQERKSGFAQLLRTTRHGRLPSVAAKTVVYILLAAGVTVLFTLENFYICGMAAGYADANNALQILRPFAACPYVVTLGEYFWISLGFRLLAVLTLTAVCMLAAQYIRHIAVLFLIGLGVLGANIPLYTMRVYTADSLPKHLNLIALSYTESLWNRYNAVWIGGRLVEFPRLAIGMYAILLAFLLGGILVGSGFHGKVCLTRKHRTAKTENAEKEPATQLHEHKKYHKRYKIYPSSLWTAECVKIFLQHVSGLLFLCCCCANAPSLIVHINRIIRLRMSRIIHT